MSSIRTDAFHFIMIKPSHYDDDGYPIQWLRSDIPSNTLAAVNGLALDSVRARYWDRMSISASCDL